jgi:hypothetical protein
LKTKKGGYGTKKEKKTRRVPPGLQYHPFCRLFFEAEKALFF